MDYLCFKNSRNLRLSRRLGYTLKQMPQFLCFSQFLFVCVVFDKFLAIFLYYLFIDQAFHSSALIWVKEIFLGHKFIVSTIYIFIDNILLQGHVVQSRALKFIMILVFTYFTKIQIVLINHNFFPIPKYTQELIIHFAIF